MLVAFTGRDRKHQEAEFSRAWPSSESALYLGRGLFSAGEGAMMASRCRVCHHFCLSVVQAEFSEHHEAEVGNEAIVKGLVDLRKYWDALEGDFRVEETGGEGLEDEKKGRTHLANHGVLLLALHVAAHCIAILPRMPSAHVMKFQTPLT